MRKHIKLNTSIIVTVIFLSLATVSVFGQNVRKTDYKADQVLKSNARVNPSTFAMELSLPIGGYAGRGETGVPIVFNYSSKVWQIKATQTWESWNGIKTDTRPMYGKRSAAGWTSNLGVPRIDYQFDIYYNEGGYEGSVWVPYIPFNEDPPPNYYLYYIKRVQVTMPDGSSHEFRKDDTIHSYGTSSSPGGAGLPDQAGTFLSVDGSKMRLELAESNSTLFLPDGSRYLFGAKTTEHKAYAYLDRNGNQMNYDAANKRWTDSMGRIVNDPLPMSWGDFQQTQTVGDNLASFPSFNSGTLNATFHWRYLKDPQGGESGLENMSDSLHNLSNVRCLGNQTISVPAPYLFTNPEPSVTRVCNTTFFNPIVLTKITLPNGQTYQFKYNVYGEITKIIYPTGAYERFAYGQVPLVQPQDVSYDQANRGVVNRWVSAKGDGTDELQWNYLNGVITNPDGTKTQTLVHTESAGEPQPFGFGNAKTGFPYEEKVLSPTNQILRRKLTEYETSGAQAGGYSGATRDLRPKKEVSIIIEPGASSALATMSETIYDTNADPQYFASLNPKQVKNHNFIVLDLTTAQTGTIATISALFNSSTLATIGETDYLYDANYKARNIVTLPIETRIKNAAGTVQSASQVYYDEGAYPILSSGGTVGWTDPNTTYRGNPTTARSWVNTNNSWIETHSQYDNFGNVRKSWDARGNLSEVEYASTYYFAYPTKTKSPIPDPSGQNGSSSLFETNATFDFVTGLALTMTDANGQVTAMEYNDPLLRPTRVIPPSGGSTSEIIYNDTPGNIWVKTRTQIDATNWKEGIEYADNLGRAIKTQSIDNQGDVFTETVYDNMGRAYLSSNPYRNGETKYWTQTNFDVAGRPKEIVTPDGAKVQTSYDVSTSGLLGTVTTVTDQANKQRRSITNALGQLIRVDEPDDAGNLGTVSSPTQPTNYQYSTIGKMVKVTQGVQSRFFLYDSLGRLLRVRQPEQVPNGSLNLADSVTGNSQWTAGFTYDANSNLLTALDAKGVLITSTYDNINRALNRTYSDGTPTVTYSYDNPAIQFSKGQLTQVSNAVSTSQVLAFDNLGRTLASRQITDGTNYDSSYLYNLSGALVEETYPSGRKVKNTFENDGDLSKIETQQVGQAYQVRAQNLSYTASGVLEKLQIGNGLWETAQLNSRLQVTQLGLGTSPTDTSVWKLNYDFGTTNNDGNIKSQTLTTPTAVFNQNFQYDSLDRLKQAQETTGGNQTWIQNFSYDRYGNRAGFNQTINGQTTSGTPTVDVNTNRFNAGQGYVYDFAGNVVQDQQNKQFIFNGDNKQVEVRNASNQIIGQYFYDGDGKRIKKITNTETTIFVYSGGKLVAEYTVPTSTPTAPSTQYLGTDMLGSPRVITDQNAQIVSRRDFMPFGEDIPNFGARTQANGYKADNLRQKFTGYQKDNETGLDFAEARYYHDAVGRFTAVDPLMASGKSANPQTFNRYVYVMNSPLVLSDPSGLMGDYYDRNGNRIGSDGKDDGRVYYADVVERRGNDIDVTNIEETTWSQFRKDTVLGNYGGAGWNILAKASNFFYDVSESSQYLQVRYWGCAGGGPCPEKTFPRTVIYQAGTESGQRNTDSMEMALNFGLILSGYPKASVPSFAGFTTRANQFASPSVRSIGPRTHSVYQDGTTVLEGQQPPRLGTANPLPEAQGAHTQLRIDTINNRIYQGRTFDGTGRPILDIDFTIPTYPNGTLRPNHNFMEIHPWIPHSGGFKRGKAWSP